MSDLDKIREAKKRWQETTVAKTLERFPERREHFATTSEIEMKRMFTPDDTAGQDYLRDSGYPGVYPFTRGVQPTMYRGRFWTMRQYSGFGSAKLTNERFKFLLQQGQTGLSTAFDLPTQMGYDSDDPMARGEVGKTGVAIDTLADLEQLLDGIPLAKVSTSMTINAPAAVLLAMYIAVGKKQGVPVENLRGTIQNDVLKEYMARGTYIFPPEPSMRIVADIFEYCSQHVPKWNTISISGYHIREAGSSAVQEVAFTLADGIAYVDAAIKTGLDVDAFAGRLSFFFNVHNNFLEEVAKFRAARRLWARIMKERFGAKNPKSMMVRFHTQTAGSMLTAQQPLNNVVRVTLQALASVLGGTQSLHTNSFDEALALPSEQAVTIALRTQQIIAEESGAADIIDPLGGAYAIEAMTEQIESGAAAYIETIDGLGGMVRAIMKGYPQREIQDKAYEWEKEVNRDERIIVGLNKYKQEEKPLEDLLRVDPAVEPEQVAHLEKVKAKRDQAAVDVALAKIDAAAKSGENLMPPILEAVEAYASLGEIVNTLVVLWGRYQEVIVV
ncbi:MAG: methylmalonyl-CoA mutase family protein [Candidatus Lernaella stagnicola]|nr:methylmalonyl-CoA mutase family protein [Candidatus Lernaella stagnicola]